MAGSRSSPMTRPVGPTCRAKAAVWPPAPTVPSTKTAPSWGFSQPITSSSRTGRCTFQPASDGQCRENAWLPGTTPDGNNGDSTRTAAPVKAAPDRPQG